MKEQILLLIELQKADSEIAGVQAKKQVLPEEKEALDATLKTFEDAVEAEKGRLDDLYKTHREKESQLNAGAEKIKTTKSRLLEVKTNKEYEAALKEIDSITLKNSHIEDEIIYILDDIEHTKGNLGTKEKELADYRAIYDRERDKIEGELGSIDSVLDGMTTRCNTIRNQISDDLIKKYDILKVKRNGYAVVPVWKEVCDGCHMNLPPQMYNELQKPESLMLCPNCNRIIYWEDRQAGDGLNDA